MIRNLKQELATALREKIEVMDKAKAREEELMAEIRELKMSRSIIETHFPVDHLG